MLALRTLAKALLFVLLASPLVPAAHAASIDKLSLAGFTHDLTNFPLKDAHVALACGACHRPATPYRKTPSTCIECHRKDDIHHAELGTDCASCHDAKAWQQTRFDH